MYETLITEELFNQCQRIREQRGRTNAAKTAKHPFLFRGLLTCAISGRQVTSDLKKGKYVYLICRNPDAPEKKLWIKEKDIIQQIEDALDSIRIPQEHIPSLKKHIQKVYEAEKAYHYKTIKNLHTDAQRLDEQMDKLTDLLLHDSIPRTAYDRKMNQIKMKRDEIKLLIDEHDSGNDNFHDSLVTLMSLASQASSLFKSSKTPLKRSLITTAFSNLELHGGNLRYTFREPFGVLQDAGDYKEWLC